MHRFRPRYPRPVTKAVFDRFNEHSIKIILGAQNSADGFGHGAVFTDHILLSLARSLPYVRDVVGPATLEQLVKDAERPRDLSGFGPDARTLFTNSVSVADREGCEMVSPNHMVEAISMDEDSLAMKALSAMDVDADALATAARDERKLLNRYTAPTPPPAKPQTLEYCIDLNERAREGKLDPLVGREDVITRLCQILLRRIKNNPILVGGPGVGKTAIVEGLAHALVHAPMTLPYDVRDFRIYQLDIAGLISGTKERGALEQRIGEVVKFARENPDVVLFIDEIHVLVTRSQGSQNEGEISVVDILKPPLARGELACIGATTEREYSMYVTKDEAFARRFQPLVVQPPCDADVRGLLDRVAPLYAEHHGCEYSPAALDACVGLTNRFLPYRNQPDKAVDALDESGSLAAYERYLDREEGPARVSPEHVARVVETWSGIPVYDARDADRVSSLETRLRSEVIGQDAAIEAVVSAMKRSVGGMRDPRRPVACFLFKGPTGVGKTELARVLSRAWFGGRMTRFDMSEYMERHSVSKLLGSPPGYVGYEEPGALTEALRRNPHGMILLDEIEKSHAQVCNVLLQAMEDGRITDGKGQVVKTSDAIIVMTSNLRDDEMLRFFRPEFLNRLDEIVEFLPLGSRSVESIMERMLGQVREKMGDVRVTFTPELRSFLLSEGYDPEYGARPMRRAIERHVEDVLADFLLRRPAISTGVVVDVGEVRAE
jgi:ATP-dependent Clp protease ATP-binding subunit ClpC